MNTPQIVLIIILSLFVVVCFSLSIMFSIRYRKISEKFLSTLEFENYKKYIMIPTVSGSALLFVMTILFIKTFS